MRRSTHVRAAMEDEALNLCEEMDRIRQRQGECDCDLDYLCIWHRAERWLRDYDQLIALVESEKNQ